MAIGGVKPRPTSRRKDGSAIVLTASKAEMSHYGGDPFKAFICTFPQLFSRRVLGEHLVSIPEKDRTERFAPLGLRKVEAILAAKYGAGNVVVSHPDNLGEFIGSNTKVVGISTMDPIGLAYVSTTYNKLIGFGGESLNAAEFKDLLTHPAILNHRPKVVVGGAGVWQIKDAGLQEAFGIDVLFQGEGEEDIVPIFERLMNGGQVQKCVHASKTPDRTRVPQIAKPASYGAVEITRGCGRGCAFCSPTNRKKHSFPLEYIMKEVSVNIKGGSKSIFTVTEDMFLYKSHPGFLPNTPEIVKLYKTIASHPGVEYILLSHASLAPVLYDENLLAELTPTLLEKSYWNEEHGYKKTFVTAEVGIETGSARLMNKHMKGKALPFSVDGWSDIVLRGIGTMNDHDWWPLCTIMTGQPDETEDDVRATLDLIDGLRTQNSKMFYTPVLFIPLEDAMLSSAKRSSLESLSELQWEVVTKCWRNNIDFWQPERSWLYSSMFFLSHWFYARWRHGKKSTRPMMQLAGFSDDSITLWALGKWSNLRLPETIGSKLGSLRKHG